jgi:hypothetical protein
MGATCSSDGTSCNSAFASCKTDHCASSCTKASKVVLDATQIDEMILAAIANYHDKVEEMVLEKLQVELAKLGLEIKVTEVLGQSERSAVPTLVTHNLAPPQVRDSLQESRTYGSGIPHSGIPSPPPPPQLVRSDRNSPTSSPGLRSRRLTMSSVAPRCESSNSWHGGVSVERILLTPIQTSKPAPEV